MRSAATMGFLLWDPWVSEHLATNRPEDLCPHCTAGRRRRGGEVEEGRKGRGRRRKRGKEEEGGEEGEEGERSRGCAGKEEGTCSLPEKEKVKNCGRTRYFGRKSTSWTLRSGEYHQRFLFGTSTMRYQK